MATIYHYETGHEISAGIQGSNVSDAAIDSAKAHAMEHSVEVVLEDDDGIWLIRPYRDDIEEIEPDWAE